MRPTSGPPFRAEHIGSLIRPPELLRARQQHAAGQIHRDRLAAIENEAIARVVKLQEDLGLQVVTDGEFRRGTYSDSFTSAGISGVKIEMTEDQGWARSQSHGHRMARRIPTIVSRIAWKGPQNAADFRFLRSLTACTPKITLPGPCYIHYRAGRANISRDAYPDLDAFWSDLVEAYTQEMRSLAEAGCTYLQIDETSLVMLGLVASKVADWESVELLKRRIEDASRYVKLEQLGLSPQCGFSTSAAEHVAVNEDVEKAKLARVVEVARQVWGE